MPLCLAFWHFCIFLNMFIQKGFFLSSFGNCFLFCRLTTTIIFLVFVISWGCFGSFFDIILFITNSSTFTILYHSVHQKLFFPVSSDFILFPLASAVKIQMCFPYSPFELSPRPSMHFIPPERMSSFQMCFLLDLCEGGYSL